MANVDEVSKLKVEQLKELAEKHGVEVASSDKKDDLVLKLSDAITPEDLEAYNKTQADDESEKTGTRGAPDQANGGDNNPSEPAPTTEEANSVNGAADRITPPVAASGLGAEATDEAYDANNQVNPAMTPAEVKEAENKEAAEKEETRKAESKVVDTELGTSEEESAAARAGVPEQRLENPKQNREPKNEFEQSNQKVTEQERQAAQEVSDMSTKDRVEDAPTPQQSAVTDATKTAEVNQGSEIANAIRDGLAGQKEDKNIVISTDDSVQPRFALVRDKSSGEVMIRENETGLISKVQFESLEEKEASLQDREVEEI